VAIRPAWLSAAALLPQLVYCDLLLAFPGFACCVLAFDQQLSLAWPQFGWPAFLLAWTGRSGGAGRARAALGVFEAVPVCCALVWRS